MALAKPTMTQRPTSCRGTVHTEGIGTLGAFFLIKDEKARPGGDIFDTLSIKGFDTKTEGFFARTFENHGFYRNYALTKDNDLWTLTGKTERATISFSDKNRKQTIIWEWKPSDRWLPLCDRTAVRLD